jgi:tight adherence protein B
MTQAATAAGVVIVTACMARSAARISRNSGVVRRVGSRLGGGDVDQFAPRSASAIPRLTAPSWLAKALTDAGVDVAADTVWSAWVGSELSGVAVALITGGPALGVLAGVALTLAPLAVLRATRGRGPARIEAALPGGLESVARALRSGASLRQAVDEASTSTPGALGHELRRVANEAGHGVPLVAALEALALRRPLPGMQLAIAALCLGAETGGAQAQAVDGVATTIRERLAVAAEARALASQARMSALVIGIAPIGFGVFAASTDPRTAQFLLHTSAGIALLAAGLTLDGLGWLWMNRLCRVVP